MKHIVLTTLMVTALSSGSALAQMKNPHGGHGGPTAMFEHMDSNDDGVITQAEAREQRAKMFDRLDRNDDGFLEDAEKRLGRHKHHAMRKMHRAERKADRQLALDTDKDGKVSLAEFEAKPSPMFTRMDSNGDGAISAEEHANAKHKMFSRMDVNGDGFLTPDDKTQRREQHRAKMKEHALQLDADKDGKISKAEFVDADTPMFAHFDLNKDGKITREEMENAPRKDGHHKH